MVCFSLFRFFGRSGSPDKVPGTACSTLSNAEPPFEVILEEDAPSAEGRWLVRGRVSVSGSVNEKKDRLGSCRLDWLSTVCMLFGAVLLLDSECGLSFEFALCLSLNNFRSGTLSSAFAAGVGEGEADG